MDIKSRAKSTCNDLFNKTELKLQDAPKKK